MHDATTTLGLENEIEAIISSICNLNESDTSDLNYQAIPIANKFYPNELVLKSKITGYILCFY